ncbi:FTR1 family iron permease [Bradyrhizobium sp.]|uniref:FTR1 family iron permease n=1 Tax=Bradyrhizobium sp. TaxID=376 RepID=UPI002D51905E|nr:FTR1 family protein [Bradyrhizobium sp.]HZR73056.1 FTR1 family protein [Bradyrhizobium sp.]
MFGALIIVFREVVEAGLIVGIVLVATRGVSGRGKWVSLGLLAGIFGATLVAAGADVISDAVAGTGQELLNAIVLMAAVAMLMWHNAWMAGHGREMAADMIKVGEEVTRGRRPLAALAVVVGLAVLREGLEVVLFLYGIIVGGATGWQLLAGGLLGVMAGVALTAVTYLGLVSIPARYIFTVTTLLITLLAAGMAAQAVQFLDAAGVLTVLTGSVWDTSAWLPQNGIVGTALHALMGYNERPSLMQLIVYIAVLVAMLLLMRIAGSSRRRLPAT